VEALLLRTQLFDNPWKGVETYIGLGLTPWRGVMAWVPDIARMTGDLPTDVVARLRNMWLAQLQEQQSWNYTTDGDRLDAAFVQLRGRGIYTAAAWGCCDYCGEGGPVPEAGATIWAEAVVHRTSATMLADGYLPIDYGNPSWSEWDTDDQTYIQVQKRLVDELRAQGLVVDWDGSPAGLVAVVSSDWKHRMPE
jgi:hypothetical protein